MRTHTPILQAGSPIEGIHSKFQNSLKSPQLVMAPLESANNFSKNSSPPQSLDPRNMVALCHGTNMALLYSTCVFTKMIANVECLIIIASVFIIDEVHSI